MKKIIIISTFLVMGFLSKAQDYCNGFIAGYKNGYCDGKVSCVPPITPTCPVLRVGESSNSYTDGYNRGFGMGLEKAKNNNSNTSSNSGANYQFISQFVPVNLNAIESAMTTMQARYDQNRDYRDKIIDWIFDLKTKINEVTFLSYMDYYYKKLRKMDGQDFGSLGNELDIIKQDVKEQIDNYNTRVREATTNSVGDSINKGNKKYMITIGEFGIYDEPIADGTIIIMLPENTKVTVYGKVDWFYIVEYNGIKGYMKESFLK